MIRRGVVLWVAMSGKLNGPHPQISLKCHICKRIWDFLDAEHRHGGGGVGIGLVGEVLQGELDCQQHADLIRWACNSSSSSGGGEAEANANAKIPSGWQQSDELVLFFDSAENAYFLHNIRGPGLDSVVSGRFNILREGQAETAASRVRLTDPEWVDRDVFRRWKDLCDRNHGNTRRDIPWLGPEEQQQQEQHQQHQQERGLSRRVRPRWLIDVEQRCLVRTPEGEEDTPPYVALSYVWGTKPCYVSPRENLHLNQQPGALRDRNEDLPGPGISRTALDAIEVTRLLGERHLWVDALCIVQDDAEQKMAEIGNMAEFYAQAVVTIIAAQSLDATSGIRGFSSCRNARQGPFRLNENTLAVRLLDGDLDDSVWASRAWKFQEEISSRRSLIFAGEGVHWQCGLAAWFEDRVESLPNNTRLLYPASMQDRLGRAIPQPQIIFPAVVKFNVRHLTFPEDALDAFAGTASVLSRSFRGGFISGLPEVFFDLALLWQPWEFQEYRVVTENDPDIYLPSWSWAGFRGSIRPWSGRVAGKFVKGGRIYSNVDVLEDVWPLVRWSCHRAVDGKDVPIRHEWLDAREKFLGNGGGRCPLAPGSREIEMSSEISSRPVAQRKYFYTHEAEPGTEFWWPVPLPGKDERPRLQRGVRFITCRTRRAWLRGHGA